MSLTDSITYWRYKLIPDHLLGDILAKRWIDNAIPFLILIVVVATFGSLIPGFFGLSSLSSLTRQLGEVGLVVLAMMIVMVAGGIDLSVGSTFALANIVALALLNVAGWPDVAVIAATLATGAFVGFVNGLSVT
jgi:ribose transport system permease protein